MSKPAVITFAGAPGTSKSPLANYLSYTLNLPIIQMDAIRMEVKEDLLKDDGNDPDVRAEFWKRAEHRYQKLLASKINFIDDSSADRSWKQKPGDQYDQLEAAGYRWFIISLDLSKEFISKLYKANHSLSSALLDKYYDDHETFRRLYADDIGLSINDDTFHGRMQLAEAAVANFLGQ